MGPLPTHSWTLPNSILIESQRLSKRLDSLPIFDWQISLAYATTFLCILLLQYIFKLIPCSQPGSTSFSLLIISSYIVFIYLLGLFKRSTWPNIRGSFNKFPDFFVQAFEIVVDSWKFSMLLLYLLWDDWPISRISASNEQLQQQLEYTLIVTAGEFQKCNLTLYKNDMQ